MPFDLGTISPTLVRVLVTLAILAAGFLIARLGRRLADRLIEDTHRKYRVATLISRSAAGLAFLLIIALWSSRLGALFTILTIIGAGMAVALRDVLLSFVGWLDISLSTPYKQGDRIEVNGVRGDVVDVRVLHTILMEIGNWVHADQSTGRLTRIPNSWIFLHEVSNYTRGFGYIWNELEVTVTFRSDWQAAHDILLELGEEATGSLAKDAKEQIKHMAREHLVDFSVLTPFVYVNVVDNGICLTLRHLCPARGRRNIRHEITTKMLDRFRKHGQIEFAYPMRGAQVFNTPQFGPDAPHFDPEPPNTQPPPDAPPES